MFCLLQITMSCGDKNRLSLHKHYHVLLGFLGSKTRKVSKRHVYALVSKKIQGLLIQVLLVCSTFFLKLFFKLNKKVHRKVNRLTKRRRKSGNCIIIEINITKYQLTYLYLTNYTLKTQLLPTLIKLYKYSSALNCIELINLKKKHSEK